MTSLRRYSIVAVLTVMILSLITSAFVWSPEIHGSPYSAVWNETRIVRAPMDLPENSSDSYSFLMNTNRVILCNNTIIYPVSFYFAPDEGYGNLSFTSIVIVGINDGVPRLENVIRLNDIVVNTIAFDKTNNTIYIAGLDTSRDFKLKIDLILLGNKDIFSYYFVGFFEGVSSRIIKIDCNGTVIGEARIENFTVRSIDFNDKYGLLAVLGYDFSLEYEPTPLRDWRIILMNSDFEEVYRSSSMTIESGHIAPSGVQWSPSGKYLSCGLRNQSIPLIYEYNPVSRILNMTYTINITDDILTNSWITISNRSDLLLIGTENDIYLIDMNNSPTSPIAELHTGNKKLCCGVQAIKNAPVLSFVEARYYARSETEKLLLLYLGIESLNSTTQWISEYQVNARDFINREILPIQFPNDPNSLYYTRIGAYSYMTKAVVTFKLIKATVIKNSLLTIHTIPGSEIRIINMTTRNPQFDATTDSDTLKTYLPPGQYSITVTLPRPENYIGSIAGLTDSILVNLSSQDSLELYLDYQNLLGTIRVESDQNITITLHDPQTGQVFTIEPGREYYVAPGTYILETTSNSPLILANTSYHISIDRGEEKVIQIPLSQIRVFMPENNTIEISGPGGTTRIQTSGKEIIVYAIPGEYTIKIIKDNETVSKLVLKVLNESSSTLDLPEKAPEETTTNTTTKHTELEPNNMVILIIVALVAILIGTGYFLRSKQ